MNQHADSISSTDANVNRPKLRSRHLLSISDLSTEEILLILETAQAMKEVGTRPIKKVPTLRGKTVVNLFLNQAQEPARRLKLPKSG